MASFIFPSFYYSISISHDDLVFLDCHGFLLTFLCAGCVTFDVGLTHWNLPFFKSTLAPLFPPQQQQRGMQWTLSLVTSALSHLSTCLSTLSLQINNKANVVTSPKEPVPTPSLVHCPPALLPACLHDCLSLSYLSVHTFSDIRPDYAAVLNSKTSSICQWWLFLFHKA